jgi:inner membrane protein
LDSLTQIVLGASVGEAVLGKKVGNKALLYGAIAGTIPDLDVIFGIYTDTITAIEWHRGFSHSLFFSLLLAPILGWLVNKLERKLKLGWKPWAKLFFLGLFTHPILDAFTTWGTQLFWPFPTRIALNSIFVIDPLYTLPFLVCTVSVLFYQRDSNKRNHLNKLGLLFSTFYLLSTVVVKQVVIQQFEKALHSQEITYTQLSSRPAAFSTILWNANIDTPDAYLIGDYSIFDTQSIRFIKYPKKRNASTKMLGYPNVQRLISISKGWFILEQKKNEWYFNDLRFGTIPKKDGTDSFTFSYQLKLQNNKITARELPKTGMDPKFLLRGIWERIKGN